MFRFGVFPLGRLAVGTVNAKWQQVHCHRRFAVSLNIEGKKGKEGRQKKQQIMNNYCNQLELLYLVVCHTILVRQRLSSFGHVSSEPELRRSIQI